MELAMQSSTPGSTDSQSAATRPTAQKTPRQLWAVGGLTLLWSLYGAARFLVAQFGLFEGAVKGSGELALFASFPIWASAFWALTVWGSVAGAAFLLLRSGWAVQGFVVAVIGLIGTSVYQFVLADNAVSIYDMPIALSTWIIVLVAMLFASMVRDAGHLS